MIDPDDTEAADSVDRSDIVGDEMENDDDPRVTAVLLDLERLGDLPVEEHVAVYDTIHAKLREVLTQAAQSDPGVGSA